MTISFFEPGDVPQPPDNVKIERLDALPHPDGWRVKIELHVTPFQQRPNFEVILLRRDEDGTDSQIANLSIVETMHPKMEFTMHIRGVDDPNGDYLLRAILYYREHAEEGAEEPPPVEIKDQREIMFSIPHQVEETEESKDA
ncbi:MAG: hypothetical protein GYB66_15395 [Chloroflexi bacterium]|nr:hypothetical protein [Chloroflexota bacterium]